MASEFLYPVCIWLICVNIIGFIMAGLDKIWAIRKQWRVAEKWFFRLTFVGSGLGIFLGCLAFHHKIRNKAFMIGIPLISIAEAGLAFFLYHYLSKA